MHNITDTTEIPKPSDDSATVAVMATREDNKQVNNYQACICI